MIDIIRGVPGRLRIKNAAFKHSPSQVRHLKKLLAPLYGIQSFDVNPITGSMLIRYDFKEISEAQIIQALHRNGAPEGDVLPTPDYFKTAMGRVTKLIAAIALGVVKTTA